MFDDSGTDGKGCYRKLSSRKKAMGEITSFVNARDLRFGCARVLYEGLLGAALMNGTEKIMNA